MADEEAATDGHPTTPATPTAALERTQSRSRSRPKTPLSTEREDFFRRLSSPKPRTTGAYKPPPRDMFYDSLRPREPEREIPPCETYTFPLEFYNLTWSQYLAIMTGLNKKRMLAGQLELVAAADLTPTPTPTRAADSATSTPTPTRAAHDEPVPKQQQGGAGAEAREAEAGESGDGEQEGGEDSAAFPIEILKLIASYCAPLANLPKPEPRPRTRRKLNFGPGFTSPRRSILAQHRTLPLSSSSPAELLVHKQKWVCPRSGCFEVNPPNTLACHTCGEVAIPAPRQRRPTSPSIAELISKPIAPRAASAHARPKKRHSGGGPNNPEVIAARQKMSFSTPPPSKVRSRSLIHHQHQRGLTGERPRSRRASLHNRYRAKTLTMTNIPGGGCSQTSYFLSLSPPPAFHDAAEDELRQVSSPLKKKRGSLPTPTVTSTVTPTKSATRPPAFDHNSRSRSVPSSPVRRRRQSQSPVPLPRNNGKLKMVPLPVPASASVPSPSRSRRGARKTSGVPKPRVVNFLFDSAAERERGGEAADGFDAPTESAFNENGDESADADGESAVTPMKRRARSRHRFSPLVQRDHQDERDRQSQGQGGSGSASSKQRRRRRRESVSMSPVRSSPCTPPPRGGRGSARGSASAARGISHQYGHANGDSESSRVPLALSANPLTRHLTIATPGDDDAGRAQPGTWSPIDFGGGGGGGGGQYQHRVRSRSRRAPADLVAAGLVDDAYTSDSSATADDAVVRSVVGALAAAAAADGAYAGLTDTPSPSPSSMDPRAHGAQSRSTFPARAEGDAPLPARDNESGGVRRERSTSTNSRAEGQLLHGEDLETSFSSTSSTNSTSSNNTPQNRAAAEGNPSTSSQKAAAAEAADENSFALHSVDTAGVFFQGATPIAVAGSGAAEDADSRSAAAESSANAAAGGSGSGALLANPDTESDRRSRSPSLAPLNPESHHLQHSVLAQHSGGSLEAAASPESRGAASASSAHSKAAQESKDTVVTRTGADSPDTSDSEEESSSGSAAQPIALAPASPVRERVRVRAPPAKAPAEHPSSVVADKDLRAPRAVSPATSASSSSGDDEQTVAELALESAHTSPVRDNAKPTTDHGERLRPSMSLSDQLSGQVVPQTHSPSARPQRTAAANLTPPPGSPIKKPAAAATAHPHQHAAPLRSSQVISPLKREVASQLSSSSSSSGSNTGNSSSSQGDQRPSLATCEDSDIILDARKHLHAAGHGHSPPVQGDSDEEDKSARAAWSASGSASSSDGGEYNANERSPQPVDSGSSGTSFKSILLSEAFSYQNRVPDSRQTLSTIDEEDSEESDSDLSLIADSDESAASRSHNGSDDQDDDERESPKAAMQHLLHLMPQRRRRAPPSEKDIAEERDDAFGTSSTKERPPREEAPVRGTGLGVGVGVGVGGLDEDAEAFLDGQEIGGDADGADDNTSREAASFPPGTRVRVLCETPRFRMQTGTVSPLADADVGTSSSPRRVVQFDDASLGVKSIKLAKLEEFPGPHESEMKSVDGGASSSSASSYNFRSGAVGNLEDENEQLRMKVEILRREGARKEAEIRNRERSASSEIRNIKKDLEKVINLQSEQLASARAQSDAFEAVARDKARRRTTCGSRLMKWMFNIMMIVVCLWVARSIYMHAHSCRFHCPPHQDLSVGCGICLVEAVLPHRDGVFYY